MDIAYPTQCEICETHKTERGEWESIKQSVFEMFPNLPAELGVQIMICWYEQTQLDKRTNLIQSFKKTNIKAINKEGK
jgi:hypothetical protein